MSARTVAWILLLSVCVGSGLAAVGSPGPSARGGLAEGGSVRAIPPAQASAAAPVTGIAYVRDREVRLIQPDGSGDRLLWAQPMKAERSLFVAPITDLAWRPDGGELAFTSDHEQAYSWFQDDIYAVGADGSGLRRLTNPPAKADVGRYPTGTVKVTVSNRRLEGGPYFVYAMGASKPATLLLGPGSAEIVTFTVADLGETGQPVVAIYGEQRFFGALAPNVQAGRTVDAGDLVISAYRAVKNFGARSPAWRSDGSNLAYVLSPTCTIYGVAATPAIGPSMHALVDAKAFQNLCTIARGPTPATADRMLLATPWGASTAVYLATEGSTTLGKPILSFDDYNWISDVKWLPDASGFILSRRDSLMDDDFNLYEYSFASGRLRQLTDLQSGDEHLGRFSLSPDGRRIVYEMGPTSLIGKDRPGDLYVIDRNGSNRRLLVKDAVFPAWSPARR